jgi:regulator of replication initiation timing
LKLKAFEAKIRSLENEIDEQRRELESTIDERDGLRIRCEQLDQLYKKTNDELQEQIVAKRILQQKCDKLGSRSKRFEKNAAELNEEKVDIEKELEGKSNSIFNV